MTGCCSYKWVILLASLVIRLILYGITYTSGIVYIIVLDTFGTGRAETSWISSLITAVFYIIAPLGGRLVKRFKWRKVAVAGGIITACGLAASTLSTNLVMLCIFYGFVAGIGCGLAYLSSISSIPAYFHGHPRQKLANAVASMGGGLGQVFFSPLIEYTDDVYGWKVMFYIMAGISLLMSVSGLFFPPLANHHEHNEVACSWSFLKKWTFYFLSSAYFVNGFATSIVYGHLVAFALTLGISDYMSAILISIIGIATALAKLFQGLLSDTRFRIFKSLNQSIIFIFLQGVATVYLVFSPEYCGLVVYCVFFGFGYAVNGGAIFVDILHTYFGVNNIELTLGTMISFYGIGNLFGAPVAGWVLEYYDSYKQVFIMTSLLPLLSCALLLIPWKFASTEPLIQNKEIIIYKPVEETEPLLKGKEFILPVSFMEENSRTETNW